MNKPKVAKVLRWIARIIAFLFSFFLLFMFVGSFITDVIIKGDKMNFEVVPQFSLIGLAMVGYILTWFNEKWGIVLMILASLAVWVFVAVTAMMNGFEAGMTFALPYLIPSALLILARRLERDK